MGGLQIPSDKNRKKIINHRKQAEREAMRRPQRPRTATPQPSTSSDPGILPEQYRPQLPPVIQAEVLRSCQGAAFLGYLHEGVQYYGVIYACNTINNAPGVIQTQMSRFRDLIDSYSDAPLADQWTSVVGERFITSGLQLRDRNCMKSCGRMVCAGCMFPVPEHEVIPRRHFINPNQRKLMAQPRNTYRVVAQCSAPRREQRRSPVSPPMQQSSMRAQKTTHVVEQSADDAGSVLGAEYLPGFVNGSCRVTKSPAPVKNKRKDFTPRGAYSVIVPAGVDPFEPEYDPVPGSSSSSDESYIPREAEGGVTKANQNGTAGEMVGFKRLTKVGGTLVTGNVRTAAAVLRANMASTVSGVNIGRAPFSGVYNPNSNSNSVRAHSLSATSVSRDAESVSDLHGNTVRFNNEGIRNALSYEIQRGNADSPLHMKLVRLPNEGNPNVAADVDPLMRTATAHVRRLAPLVVPTAVTKTTFVRPSPPPRNNTMMATDSYIPRPATPKNAFAEDKLTSAAKNQLVTKPDGEAPRISSPQMSHRPVGVPEQSNNKSPTPVSVTNEYESILVRGSANASDDITKIQIDPGNVAPSRKTEKPQATDSDVNLPNDGNLPAKAATHAPIKMVLKVKKTESIDSSSPSNSNGSSARKVTELRYPSAIEKTVLKTCSTPRRSDGGYPPMSKPPNPLLPEVKQEEGLNSEDRFEVRRTGSRKRTSTVVMSEFDKQIKEEKRRRREEDSSGSSDDDDQVVPSKAENVLNLKVGDVVWAKSGSDAYWPGRLDAFRKVDGKSGARIVWFGATTYSPFIEFSRLEKFVASYSNRFNPKRADQRYHRAVADGIIACLPEKGYFEKKLSPQVLKVLLSEHHFNPGEVNVITKRKKKPASQGSASKKKKAAVRKSPPVIVKAVGDPEQLLTTNKESPGMTLKREVKVEQPQENTAPESPASAVSDELPSADSAVHEATPGDAADSGSSDDGDKPLVIAVDLED